MRIEGRPGTPRPRGARRVLSGAVALRLLDAVWAGSALTVVVLLVMRLAALSVAGLGELG